MHSHRRVKASRAQVVAWMEKKTKKHKKNTSGIYSRRQWFRSAAREKNEARATHTHSVGKRGGGGVPNPSSPPRASLEALANETRFVA